MANEFVARNGFIAKANSTISGTLDVSGNITMGTALVATRSWVTGTALVGYATESYVNTAISNLTDSAPDLLNTLNELSAALGDDPNFATTITTSIGAKVAKAGDTMTGNLNWGTSDRGITWSMNTDAAYIKFFNTGDGDTNSRLEYATADNGNEFHRWMIATVEEMTLKSDGLRVTNDIWTGGNKVATETFVTTRGYLTAESDPIFVGSPAYNIEQTNIDKWDLAFGWGDHDGLYAAASHTHSATDITSGTLAAARLSGNYAINVTGSAATLTTARTLTIGNTGKTFNGSANVSWSLAEIGAQPAGSYLTEIPDEYLTETEGNALYQPIGSYLTAESDTLATVTGRGATTSTSSTFSGGLVASGGISGLTLANGISGTNFNITGVNQLEIADPGEGIVFKAGSSGDMTLAIVDDASDNILRFAGTNAVFQVNTSTVWHAGNDGAGSGLDADLLDGNHASAFYLATNPSGYITSSSNITGTSAGVVRTVSGTSSAELVRGNMGDNDQARILVGATASNAGYLEIATADDGTEPIYVRQYTGVFSTLTRTATILDNSGNTSFPGVVSASGGNSTNWNTAYGWGNHSGLYLGINSKAADSNLLDGIDSSSFLRSNVVDATVTGTILSTNNANVDGANFEVNTTNKSVNEYAYKVSRSGGAVGGIYIDGRGVFPSLTAGGANITSTTVSNWNTAYGWGNHADYGYLTSETDSQELSWLPETKELSISGGNSVILDGLATEEYVTSQGYLTSLPSHNHDDRYYTESESDSRFVNVSGDTMNGSLSFDAAAVIKKKITGVGDNPVKTASGVLASRSDNSSGYVYYVIETTVPQDNYQMGGFTIELFGRYGETNNKTKIDLGGYWNPEPNGGFQGFEAHGTNPQYKPTIEVARNSAGNTAFIIYGVSWSYPVIVARDLWLGYNSTDPGTYGEGWTIAGTNDVSSYTNKDTVIWRNAYSDSNPAGYITGYTETDTLASVTGRGNTANSRIIINSTGTAGAPTLSVNTSTSLTFVHSQENLAANLTAGQHNIIVVGKTGNTKNSGYIGYYWAGAASNSNFVTIGHWGADDLFRVYADGRATVGTNTVWHAGNVGSGSGLDADLLDGQQGSYYLDWTNVTNKPDPVLTLAGDATGSATFTNLGNATLTVTVVDDSHIHDGRYYTETESDARFVNVTGDTVTGNLVVSGASLGVISTSQGSEAFYVDGVNGRLFTINDDLSDSLFSVNTISGLPVIEAFADNRVNIGPFSNPVTVDTAGLLYIGGLQAATQSYVDTAITNLIGGAPGALDTLNELAAAIADDASYASTITTALASKAPLASPALTGVPTAPTAATATNTTQIATTAFVKAQGYLTSLGFNYGTGVTANYVVQRDANGYIYANYVNHNTSETENPAVNSFFVSNGDGWTRKATVAHVKSTLGLGSAAYTASTAYAAASHTHAASAITQGTFTAGRYIIPYQNGITGSTAPNYSNGGLELYTDSNHVPTLSFHRGSVSATALYEYDGQLYVKPWTTRAQVGLLLSSGNIGAYADPVGAADAVNQRIDNEVIPAIPTDNSQLANGAGYITGYTETDTLATVIGRGAYFGTTNQGYVTANAGTYGSDIRKIRRITMTAGSSNWDNDNHCIISTDSAGNLADSLSLNSYNDITFRVDTNSNNNASYVRFGNHGTGSATYWFTSGYDGARYLTTHKGDILPGDDRIYDIGQEDQRWRIVFCETLDSAGLHETNLETEGTEELETGTVLVWKGGKNVPCSVEADHMRMGIAVHGHKAPLVQGAEPVLCIGEVNEGDYLITSTTVGHAKAVNRAYVVENQLFDCVLGKALETASGESHLVKTWITI